MDKLKQAEAEKAKELLNNNNPNPENPGQWGEEDKDKKVDTYSAEDYKNLQSFSTKARQDLIAMTEKLVEANPKELLAIEDEKLRNKVIENKYWASDINELKILKPEIFEENNNDGKSNKGNTELEDLQRKVQLMEYKNNQGALKDVIENFKTSNKDLVDTIPEFEQKMKTEMELFSSDLSVKEKADRAFKLVAWNTSANMEAYMALQWKTIIKWWADEKWKSKEEILDSSPLAQAFKNTRI